LQHLAAKYRVHLGFFIDDPADLAHVPAVRGLVGSLCAVPLNRRIKTLASLRGLASGQALSLPYFFDRRMAGWVRRTMADLRPAAAFLFSSPMAQYLLSGPRPARVVMDFVDVDSAKWEQYAQRRRGPSAWLYRREARRLLEFEKTVAAEFDAGIFVTPAERALFCSLAPSLADKVHAIENGIDAVYFSPDHLLASPYPEGGPDLVFTGAMDYWPNVEAVRWFVAQVLPLLRQRLPALRFAIVGANPAAEVGALAAAPGVAVVGRVPDVRPYVRHAAAVVAPLLTARGLQNKVLEGMSMARPVVATRQAYEGVAAEPGVHLLVCDDDPRRFAEAVLGVLGAPRAAEGMGRAARRRIVERYDWSSRFGCLDDLLRDPQAAGWIDGRRWEGSRNKLGVTGPISYE
jgi:sugar transferase (PEP-CTERM/EpsH1 system associated)